MSDRPPRTVVHLHGAGDCATVWSAVSAGLAEQGIPTAFLDLPMHGRNSSPQPDSIEGYADWVEITMDELDLGDVVLSGHSMGSLIALEVASRGNRRVSRLVLGSIGSPMHVTRKLLEDASNDVESACSFMATWSSSRSAKESVADALADHDATRLALAPGVLATDLHACNNYTRAVEAARQVHIPTTVVVAERDKMVPPATADPVVAALPVVDHIELKGVGHVIQHEASAEIADILAREASRP